MGIVDLMNIGVASINAQQTAMEVSAHNVANINTPGYARQMAQFVTREPSSSRGVLLGQGVDVGSVRRSEDRFFNRNLWLGGMELGYYEARGRGLSEIEDQFNETIEGTGISGAMSEFWATWSDLASNPQASAERANVRGMAEVMAARFRTSYSRLETTRKSLNAEVRETATKVNNLLEQIADVNVRIANVERGGGEAADFRSIRNSYMGELSGYLDFSYFEQDDGSVHISAGAGYTLVESGVSASLDTRANAGNGNMYDVLYVSAAGNEADLTGKLEGGSLGGLLSVRDGDIEQAKADLNEMAFTMVNEVNAVHSTGYTLNGTTGVNFFTPLATVDDAARLIALDADILADLGNIAAGQSDEPGDNRNANAIVDLRSAGLMDGGLATIQQFYSTAISNIGIESQNSLRQYNQSTAIISQLSTYRESHVGVSIEEEMANLVRYQQAYQAAARVLNAASDLVAILNNLR